MKIPVYTTEVELAAAVSIAGGLTAWREDWIERGFGFDRAGIYSYRMCGGGTPVSRPERQISEVMNG